MTSARRLVSLAQDRGLYMKVKIDFDSYSSIRYRLSKIVEFDDDDWADADDTTRNRWVDEEARDILLDDVLWEYKEMTS